MDGHAACVGGAIVDCGKFDWMAHAEKFPGLTTPDDSYHGVTYQGVRQGRLHHQGHRAAHARPRPHAEPQGAFFLIRALESLHVRMERHCANGLAVAKFLRADPRVGVSYPGLEGDKYYAGGEVHAERHLRCDLLRRAGRPRRLRVYRPV